MTECHVVSRTRSWSRKRVCWGKTGDLGQRRGADIPVPTPLLSVTLHCHLGLRRGHGKPSRCRTLCAGSAGTLGAPWATFL